LIFKDLREIRALRNRANPSCGHDIPELHRHAPTSRRHIGGSNRT